MEHEKSLKELVYSKDINNWKLAIEISKGLDIGYSYILLDLFRSLFWSGNDVLHGTDDTELLTLIDEWNNDMDLVKPSKIMGAIAYVPSDKWWMDKYIFKHDI